MASISTPGCPQSRPQGRLILIPERVAQLYYSHGVFCSSHPWPVLLVTSLIVFFCCLPLLSLPLPGNAPQECFSPWTNFTVPVNEATVHTDRTSGPPWWYYGSPTAIIQQVIVRSSVTPWRKDLILTDAFRAPLVQLFPLLQTINSFQIKNRTLHDVCLYVEGVKLKGLQEVRPVLPEYSCLVLSPANLWGNSLEKFTDDSSILGTVFAYQGGQKGRSSSLSELLFGMKLHVTGFKRLPIHTKPRVITYAVTIIMRQLDWLLMEELKTKLNSLHSSEEDNEQSTSVRHLYFPAHMSLLEMVPLTVSYCALFVYIYFSVRKMDMVQSKLGMALGALATVLGSLGMSVGICTAFGLSFAQKGREIFPYLVVIIGLENVLVITRSVVATPIHLDVKIRVAQGLSKEGWSITKNLLTEVTILSVGFFSFVPAIQEFCVFAVVGLLSDFFLQMTFFATLLSVDVRRMEASSQNTIHSRQNIQPKVSTHSPRLNGTSVVSSFLSRPPLLVKLPKRLRLVYFWARMRFVQRAFMVCMIGWIAFMLYHSGVVEHLQSLESHDVDMSGFDPDVTYPSSLVGPWINGTSSIPESISWFNTSDIKLSSAEYQDPMKCVSCVQSPFHWSTILRIYNMSVSGSFISVLPPILLVMEVNPDEAISYRHPQEEKDAKTFNWHALAAVLNPLQLSGDTSPVTESNNISTMGYMFVPHTPVDFFLAALFALPSIVFLTYLLAVLYRCICSRNYAEWRTSWFHDAWKKQDAYTQVLLEALPISLEGHTQCVECLCYDEKLLAATCLGGELRTWDPRKGEPICIIDRKNYFNMTLQKSDEEDDEIVSDCESPPSASHHFESTLPQQVCLQEESEFSSSESIPSFSFGSSAKSVSFTGSKGYDFSSCTTTLRNNIGDANNQVQDCPLPVSYHQYRTLSPPVVMGNITGIVPPVWCIDCQEGLIALGCSQGRIELWDGIMGELKCVHEYVGEIGVTHIKLIGCLIVVGRINGSLQFLEIESRRQIMEDNHFHSREHVSPPSLVFKPGEEVRCITLQVIRAHQQPISVLDCQGGRVLTGSLDHTLKVFRLEEQLPVYTLLGHCGPISSLFIDHMDPATAGSGSQNGVLCLWDLITGMCVYSIQAHDGNVVALTYSASYVISLGSDERLCVWERFQGHLLNTIPMIHNHCNSLVMLTHNLLVTSRQGSLVVWDVRYGDAVRVVRLGDRDHCVFITQMTTLSDALLCDYGNQLRLVRFPTASKKE